MADTGKSNLFSVEAMRERALKSGPVIGELERYMEIHADDLSDDAVAERVREQGELIKSYNSAAEYLLASEEQIVDAQQILEYQTKVAALLDGPWPDTDEEARIFGRVLANGSFWFDLPPAFIEANRDWFLYSQVAEENTEPGILDDVLQVYGKVGDQMLENDAPVCEWIDLRTLLTFSAYFLKLKFGDRVKERILPVDLLVCTHGPGIRIELDDMVSVLLPYEDPSDKTWKVGCLDQDKWALNKDGSFGDEPLLIHAAGSNRSEFGGPEPDSHTRTNPAPE